MADKWKAGDLVETMFDTGAMGTNILYGRVVNAGPKSATIEWESGIRNRVENGAWGIKLARDQEDAAKAAPSGMNISPGRR